MPLLTLSGSERETNAMSGAWHVRPNHQTNPTTWVHGGLAIGAAGEVITFDQGAGEIVILLDPNDDGAEIRRVPTPAHTAHGLTAHAGPESSAVWVVDPGLESALVNGRVATTRRSAWVGLVGLDGSVRLRLTKPAVRSIRDTEFRPTAVAEVQAAEGCQYWLADGYGSSNIYRYDAEGGYVGLVDCSGLALAGFRTPHDLALISGSEILVADRGHARLVVVDPAGLAIRALGEGILSRPAAMARYREGIVVADLDGRIWLLGLAGRPIQHLGSSRFRRHGKYWPNDGRGESLRAPDSRHPPRMRSPHALAVQRDGSLLVSEWVIGGRLISIQVPFADWAATTGDA